MKHLLLSLSLLLVPGLAGAQAPAVGSLSNPVTFATFSDPSTLVDSSLSAHDGKIVVLMYFTPW